MYAFYCGGTDVPSLFRKCCSHSKLGQYDLIVANDVLEHLSDPWSVVHILKNHVSLQKNQRVSCLQKTDIRFNPLSQSILIRSAEPIFCKGFSRY